MKLLLSTLLLANTLSVASCSIEKTELFKDFIHTAITEEMYRFIDALTFDELIGILELAKEKRISPYSTLDIKLQLFLLRVEKLPWWDELDDNDTDDFEVSCLLYQLHSAAYERAQELIQKMPNAAYYHTLFMEQMDPKEYERLLEEQRAAVAHLFVD
jgi:hypothetical protein